MELITDRTHEDVTQLKRLQAIGWNNMSLSQKLNYTKLGARGAYNYTDLNRVETAVAELAGRFGLTLVTKTNWTYWDVPTQSEMERYLGNVVKIRDKLAPDLDPPTLPNSMAGLTYDMANNIEKVLVLAYGSNDSVVRSGDIYCGEVV